MKTRDALQMVQDAMKEVTNIGQWAKNILDARMNKQPNHDQQEVPQNKGASDYR